MGFSRISAPAARLFLLSFLLASCDRNQVAAPDSPSSTLTSRDTAIGLHRCADYAADSVLAIAHIPWMPVAERGKYLYANTPQGFAIIERSGKSHYRMVATAPAHATIVSGDYAYGADCNEISVIEISNPKRPKLISKTKFLGACDLAVNGRYGCYAAGGSVTIVDFSDPRHPRARGGLSTDSRIVGIAIYGQYLYVSRDGYYGGDNVAVLQVNISDPDSPQIVSTFGEVFSGALGISGSMLWAVSYYPDHGTNVSLYDLTGESPRWIGYVPHPYCGLGSFSISGDFVYVVGVPYPGCGDDFDPPITAIVRISDMSIIAQHGDAWGGIRAFSRIYVPRCDENGALRTVDVFSLQCE
jgi:hypothetical protein